MFLKHRKYISWILLLCAALGISAGITLQEWNRRNLSSNISETSVTMWEDTVAETQAALWEYGDTEESGTEISGPEENTYEPRTDSAGTGADFGFFSGFEGWRIAGVVFMIAGLICAGLFIFAAKQSIPLLGPEVEVLLMLSGFWSMGKYTELVRENWWMNRPVIFLTEFWLQIIVRCLLAALILVCLRSLWTWVRQRLSLKWTTVHRLGRAAVGNNEKQSRYAVVQFIWTGIALLAGGVFLLKSTNTIWGLLFFGGCLFAGILSICCLWQWSKNLDDLTQQIRRLHEGQSIEVHPGAFWDSESRLLDLLRQRDEAVQSAVISERFKVDLISNVSHDLRTPLTAILGYGELLKGESLSLEGKQQLDRLNQKAGYMNDLVESLFELTKVSSGSAPMKWQEIDIIRLLEQTLGLFDDQLKQANLEVRRHFDADSRRIVTDGNRMHQVFANLVGNAVKYTLPGTRIHLEVRLCPESEKVSGSENGGGQSLMVRMTNIAAYEMDFSPDEIVQRFARGDKARSSRGSGLGLAIAKTYTESVGGSFRVEIDGEQFSAIVLLPQK